MAQRNFNFRHHSQKVTIEESNISGRGDKYQPILNIPFVLSFSSFSLDPEFQYHLIGTEAVLSMGSSFSIGKITQFHPLFYSSSEKSNIDRDFNLMFFLTPPLLHRMEQIRNGGDIQFGLQIYLQFAISKMFSLRADMQIQSLQNYEYCRCDISFSVPQSIWVTKILPSLGYGQIKLLEIPIANTIIPGQFSKSLSELEFAITYFNNGDYDKCVAHCRAALEPLKIEIPLIRKSIQSGSNGKWYEKILIASADWLETMTKETSGVTSKTHHNPSMGHYSRIDAQIIHLVTVCIVSYAGKIGTADFD